MVDYVYDENDITGGTGLAGAGVTLEREAWTDGFHEFKGSETTTATPWIITSQGTSTVQEVLEIANLSPDDASIVVSADAGATWVGISAGKSMTFFTNLSGGTFQVAGCGPIYRSIPFRDVDSPFRSVAPHEYLYRIRISTLSSAKVA